MKTNLKVNETKRMKKITNFPKHWQPALSIRPTAQYGLGERNSSA